MPSGPYIAAKSLARTARSASSNAPKRHAKHRQRAHVEREDLAQMLRNVAAISSSCAEATSRELSEALAT